MVSVDRGFVFATSPKIVMLRLARPNPNLCSRMLTRLTRFVTNVLLLSLGLCGAEDGHARDFCDEGDEQTAGQGQPVGGDHSVLACLACLPPLLRCPLP
jgi:hypothetical protein